MEFSACRCARLVAGRQAEWRGHHRFHYTTRLIHAFAETHDSTYLDLVGAYRILCPDFSYRRAVAALTQWIRRYQRAPDVEPDPMSLLELKALVGLAHFF